MRWASDGDFCSGEVSVFPFLFLFHPGGDSPGLFDTPVFPGAHEECSSEVVGIVLDGLFLMFNDAASDGDEFSCLLEDHADGEFEFVLAVWADVTWGWFEGED